MKGYKLTIRKKKANRIAYRILGGVFILVAGLQVITLTRGYTKHPVLAAFFAAIIISYGIYLFRASFRKQAFDMTYIFDDEGLTLEHKYGTTHYDFSQIKAVTMVIADEAMIFYVLNIITEKEQFAIPLTMQKELCENIYEFMHARMPKDE